MTNQVVVFDPTAKDAQSKVRGVGRYLQILRENFPNWNFTNNLSLITNNSVFINPFFNFLFPPLFIKRKFQKQIAVIHDLIPLKYPSHFPIGLKGSLNILLNKIALRSYDFIVTDSEQSKKDIVTILNIKPERVKVIYPCLPQMFIHLSSQNVTRYTLHVTRPFLLYVGDATWNKNLVNLAKAIKLQKLPCVFVGQVFRKINGLTNSRINELKNNAGDGSLRAPDSAQQSEHWREKNFRQDPQENLWQKELYEFMDLAQNDQRFIFPGFITDEELIQLYQNAVCNLLVSRDEGFGFSYLEASSQNCPSLLSDTPIFREISSNNALFVNPEYPQEIANQIKTLNTENNLRIKLVEKSFQRSKFFSQKNFVNGFNLIIS